MRKGITYYSEKIPGSQGNYKWPARFDLTDGYLGIDNFPNLADERGSRVLLSPQQVKALLAFLKGKP